MKALIQRVSQAAVHVDGDCVGEIARGVLLFLAVEKNDNEAAADKLLQKVIQYRIFPDDAGKMNLSLRDIAGELLVVSQFTLAADTGKGLRPSFSPAADPGMAQALYQYFCNMAEAEGIRIACGQFAADMQVSLVNDGPVTFWLQV